MADDRFTRIESIFLGALDLEGKERETYLAEACGGDAEMLREVEELLAQDEDSGAFLEQAVAARYSTQHPSTIGPYVDLVPIGEGGFADVYSATQTEPIHRRVAIKILKPGLDSRAVLRRFEEERQILARLDHPNIARVLDAGSTDQGRPYFVMELVEGERIDRYAASHGLDLEARLKLIREICGAIQHAHQKGVIHRDLKPSNLLVTEVDGEPVPKVIDFGIAKATELEQTTHTMFTDRGQIVGTPEYISPEQATLGGTDVDIRTDIYSLGIVLYELLTGDLPLSRETLRRAGFVEMMSLVRDHEPSRPSTRVRESTTQGAKPVTSGISSRELIRQLEGELDWIVLKAMAKDPARRYQSASGFASDLDRYLRDEPVEARPPSQLYSLGKTIRRHRTLFTAAGIVLVVLAVALVDAHRRRLHVERARAEAEAVTEFLSDTLAEADPYNRGKDVTVLETMEAAAKSVGEDFEAAPHIRARLQSIIGHTYDRLGEHEKALELLEPAMSWQRENLGLRDPSTSETLLSLAAATRKSGDLENGERLGRELVEARTRLYGPDDWHTRAAMTDLGISLNWAGKEEEAEVWFQRALADGAQPDDPSASWRLSTMDSYANLLASKGRLDEAEPLYQEVLDRRIALSGMDHPATAFVLSNLALLRYDQGRVAECDSMLSLVLELRRKNLGDSHPSTLSTFQNLAGVRSASGRYAEARDVYEQLLPLVEVNPEGRLYHYVLNNLSYAYLKLGQLDRAESMNARAIQVRTEQLGPENRATLTARHNRGLILREKGDLAAAEAEFREVLALRMEHEGETNTNTLSTRVELGATLRERDQLTEAREHLDAARSAGLETWGKDHPSLLRADRELALLLLREGRWEDARAELLRIHATLATEQGASYGLAREAAADLAAIYEADDNPQEAQRWRSLAATSP